MKFWKSFVQENISKADQDIILHDVRLYSVLGQSSQVYRESRIHILKISSNFYILLVSLRGANPENLSSISLFVQILWPFGYFRIYTLNFSGYEDFLNLGKQFSEILKFTKPWKIFLGWKICLGYYRVLGIWFFYRYPKMRKKVKNLAQKVKIWISLNLWSVFIGKWLIQSASILKSRQYAIETSPKSKIQTV